MRRTLRTSLLFALAAAAFAAEPPTCYRDASELAKTQDNDPAIEEYRNHGFLPQYQKEYGTVFQSCFKTVAQPDDRPFSFVAAVGDNGRIIGMYSNRTTNIYSCFRDAFIKGQFADPPKSPVYIDISMQFSGMTNEQ